MKKLCEREREEEKKKKKKKKNKKKKKKKNKRRRSILTVYGCQPWLSLEIKSIQSCRQAGPAGPIPI